MDADRRARDAAYGAHRWFARRPPALLRGILLAALLPAGTTVQEFWTRYREDAPSLAGKTVYDPFMGGGTSLVEAGRLGAAVAGRDIDPIAVRLVRHELDPPKADEFRAGSEALLAHLQDEVGHLYTHEGDELPLHTFSVAAVTCPDCMKVGLLYRSPVVARGSAKAGSVARPDGITAFCPTCLALEELPAGRRLLRHCHRQFWLDAGTWAGNHYACPSCGVWSRHSALCTGAAPRKVVAVEITSARGHRTFRSPTPLELTIPIEATRYLKSRDLRLPVGDVPADNLDGRPASYGMPTFRDLFTERQLALFGAAFSWIERAALDDRVTRALTLAVSNALATNNRMCGYATDYGRLSALFSVRGYSLPALAVELNALHPRAGRGTLPRTLERVANSLDPAPRRTVIGPTGEQETVRHGHLLPPAIKLSLGPAQEANFEDLPTELPNARGRMVSLVVTDPPYFDYIAYDTLSAFYRAWTPEDHLTGDPLLPSGEDPVRTFGTGLGKALAAAAAMLDREGLVVFTYHSLNAAAWQAVGQALDHARLSVTALWPVLADPHMGHHGTQGACQYDLVVVARPACRVETVAAPAASADAWLEGLSLTELPDPDRVNCELAYAALAPRWARAS